MAFKQGTAQNSPAVVTWLSQSLCVTAWREVTNSLLEFDYVEEISKCQPVPENVWFDRTVEEYVTEMEGLLKRLPMEGMEGLLQETVPLMAAEVKTIRAWLRVGRLMEGAVG